MFNKRKPTDPVPPYTVGRRFEYLGRVFICTHNWTVIGEEWVPVVGAQYADDHGVIHSITFQEVQWPAISKRCKP